MSVILASGSPRRRELLETIGIKDFIVRPAKGEENAGEYRVPEDIVIALSRAKAQEVAALSEHDDIVIAADTIVWAGEKVLGKPKNAEDAEDMLRMLSGKTHEVYTGVTVICGDRMECEAECTEVCFRTLSEEEIRAYVEDGEPMDKAGAYGIQGKASLFVEKIIGDYFNVVGLPLCRLGQMLKAIGVQLL